MDLRINLRNQMMFYLYYRFQRKFERHIFNFQIELRNDRSAEGIKGNLIQIDRM